MPVDEAGAFEDTLARIRQRYALHFYLPPNVKAGQERNIEVTLTAAAQRRYPGAEVRFRRTYVAPSDSGVSTEAPVVVTQTPGNSPPSVMSTGGDDPNRDPDAPRLHRRPAVNQVSDRDSGGPVAAASSDNTAPASDPSTAANRGSWRKSGDAGSSSGTSDADTKAAETKASDAKSTDTAQPSGGWRKLKPGEQP